MKLPLVTTLLLLAATVATAHPVEGRWQTMDIDTGKPRGEVTLKIAANGQLEGRISGGAPKPGESAQTLCGKCPGALKDQPMLGLRMLWGMREEEGVFKDGRVLDPDTGSIYKGSIMLLPDGNSLSLRGYIGLPAFGRSTVWKRLP